MVRSINLALQIAMDLILAILVAVGIVGSIIKLVGPDGLAASWLGSLNYAFSRALFPILLVGGVVFIGKRWFGSLISGSRFGDFALYIWLFLGAIFVLKWSFTGSI